MKYSTTRDHAIDLRRQGLSLQEISEELNIAKSTASLWLRDVSISEEAKSKLAKKQTDGRAKAALTRFENKERQKRLLQENAFKLLETIPESSNLAKVFCALLWWCEGNKNESFVRFTNSDSTLMKNYLQVFRRGFALDESKFRVLMHLHAYHNEDQQKQFWSEVTRIPVNQFHKSFQKLNTGKRNHENYQGCVAVTYYDAKIAKELEEIYNAFTLKNN